MADRRTPAKTSSRGQDDRAPSITGDPAGVAASGGVPNFFFQRACAQGAWTQLQLHRARCEDCRIHDASGKTPACEHAESLARYWWRIEAQLADAIVKVCGCGLSYSLTDYRSLESRGYQVDGPMLLEYRQCSCRNTMALLVDAAKRPVEKHPSEVTP